MLAEVEADIMTQYNTNLASEFYVLACLHRLGITANLTLGNKKGVDIMVMRDDGVAVTVEVKGLAGKYEWPANNLVTQEPKVPHFVALVSFEGRIGDPAMPPARVWIVPFAELLDRFIRDYPGGRTNVVRSKVLSEGSEFENACYLIEG